MLPNKYKATCACCGIDVPPGLGLIERAGDKWVCFCRAHAPKKDDKTVQKTAK